MHILCTKPNPFRYAETPLLFRQDSVSGTADPTTVPPEPEPAPEASTVPPEPEPAPEASTVYTSINRAPTPGMHTHHMHPATHQRPNPLACSARLTAAGARAPK